MKETLQREYQISIAHKVYRIKANQRYISNENKAKRQGLWKKLAISNRELTVLSKSVETANSKYHRAAADKCIKKLERLVEDQKSIDTTTKSAHLELEHLKSQIIRVEQTQNRFEKNVVSDQQYAIHLKQANFKLRQLENRLYAARHTENKFKVNIIRLQHLIRALCVDRTKFNKLWVKIVDRLALDKKMLFDMTDQAVIAFEKGAEYRQRIDIIAENASIMKNKQIDEMTAILGSLHMDIIRGKFFSNKVHQTEMRQLDTMEMKRRNAFRQYYNETQNEYAMCLNQVKSKAGRTGVDAIIREFAKQKREYFAQFSYLNDLQSRVMQMNAILTKVKSQVEKSKSKQVLPKKKKKEKLVLESTFDHAKMKNQENDGKLNALNDSLEKYHRKLTALASSMQCESTSAHLVKDFENDAVHDHNVKAFLSEIEERLRQIIIYVYYLDWHEDDPTSQTPKVVQYIDVVNYHLNEIEEERIIHQCAECSMDAEVGGHETETPLDVAAVRETMLKKVLLPEIANRMHNISQCDLPASRALLAKSLD